MNRQANKHVLYLSTLVDDALAIVHHQATAKKISIENKIQPYVTIVGDKEQLLFVLRNIIGNSIKYTHNGGLVVAHSNNLVSIEISDNGIGISPERINSLFSIERRNTRDGTAKEKGAGLALILCKDFLESSGGKIKVSSDGISGTTVKIMVPSAS